MGPWLPHFPQGRQRGAVTLGYQLEIVPVARSGSIGSVKC